MSLFQDIDLQTVVIATGSSLSPQVNLGEKTLVAVSMPAAWTTGNLTFQGSSDGGTTWLEVMTSAAAAYTVDVAASQFVLIDPTTLLGLNAIKVRSGTSGSPVTQTRGGGTTITLVTRGVL